MGHNSVNSSNWVGTTLHLCTQNMNLFLDLLEKVDFLAWNNNNIYHYNILVGYLIFVGALVFEFVAPPFDQILTTSEQLCKVP